MGILNVSSRQLSHWSLTWSFVLGYRNVSFLCYNFVNKIGLISNTSLTASRTHLGSWDIIITADWPSCLHTETLSSYSHRRYL